LKNLKNLRIESVIDKKSNELKGSSKRSQSNSSKTVQAVNLMQTKKSEASSTSKETYSFQGTASSQSSNERNINEDEDCYSISSKC
jgi:hypothetical protein